MPQTNDSQHSTSSRHFLKLSVTANANYKQNSNLPACRNVKTINVKHNTKTKTNETLILLEV